LTSPAAATAKAKYVFVLFISKSCENVVDTPVADPR
jgi:hypothetical protein